MAVSQDYPIYDGVAPSWADFSLFVDVPGAPLLDVKDVKAFSSSSSVEVGEQRGPGGRVKMRTTGQVKYEASMTLYASGFVKFLDGLALVAPARGNQRVLSLVHFGIIQMWTPHGSTDIFERRIKGARYMGDKVDASEGTDAQAVECPLSVLEVVTMRNGVELVAL